MIEGIRVGNVMVDCADETALCDFYHKLLGWDRSLRFGRPALCSPEGLVLLFIEEPGYRPPVWPEEPSAQQKQLHFDFTVPDLAAAVGQAIAFGATRAPAQFGGDEFITMFDPAGHPFCLCAEDNEA